MALFFGRWARNFLVTNFPSEVGKELSSFWWKDRELFWLCLHFFAKNRNFLDKYIFITEYEKLWIKYHTWLQQILLHIMKILGENSSPMTQKGLLVNISGREFTWKVSNSLKIRSLSSSFFLSIDSIWCIKGHKKKPFNWSLM